MQSTSASFAFIPRKVARPTNAKSTPLPPFPKPDLAKLQAPADKGKGRAPENTKGSQADEDAAILVLLSLSDYSLWSNPDLRQPLEESLSKNEQDAGFLPLSDLLRCPQVKLNLNRDISEAAVAKALRAGDMLEVRMLVSGPSSSAWYGQGRPSGKRELGGYEVRRKDWQAILEQPPRSFTRSQWNERTLYLENIPNQYRSVSGIVRLTSSLLSDLEETRSKIQNVIFPPHHLDKPGDIPKCKGFGLITLLHEEDCTTLLEKWPWNRKLTQVRPNPILETERVEAVEARRFGFRALSKARWEQLNAEYVAYRQQLVDALVDSHPERASGCDDDTQADHESLIEGAESPASTSQVPVHITTPSSPFPLDCLVFARNIHPETNKTTLRALLATAYKTSSTQTQGSINGIDYIDFNKGMDSCYLRLGSPQHAEILVNHFSTHPTVQSQGLDEVGRVPKASEKVVTMELIQGKKEELYWEKVPEKVRRQAVDKALKEQKSAKKGPQLCEDGDELGKRRKRKREPVD